MSALEMKDEVENHLKEMALVEESLPQQIVVGPFLVSTDNVRQNLSKKRKALSQAVLEALARKLRTQSDEVFFK